VEVGDLETQLAEIETALDAGSYRPGPWDRFLRDARGAPEEQRRDLEAAITRVSDKLHLRKQPRTLPPEVGLGLEALGACAGLVLLGAGAATGSALILCVAAAVLALALQPLLKTSTGLALGIRYSYAYVWKGEPRFKLQFGSYLAAPAPRRALLHLSGTLGTPLAWLVVGAVARPSSPTLASVLFWVFAAHMLFQAVLFGLAVAGKQRLPFFGPLRLTSPGAAGVELRAALAAS
jgi:hypothetical protein